MPGPILLWVVPASSTARLTAFKSCLQFPQALGILPKDGEQGKYNPGSLSQELMVLKPESPSLILFLALGPRFTIFKIKMTINSQSECEALMLTTGLNTAWHSDRPKNKDLLCFYCHCYCWRRSCLSHSVLRFLFYFLEEPYSCMGICFVLWLTHGHMLVHLSALHVRKAFEDWILEPSHHLCGPMFS